MNADAVIHIFRTPFGMPPSKDDEPICGATLTDAYDWGRVDRPGCPACADIVEDLL